MCGHGFCPSILFSYPIDREAQPVEYWLNWIDRHHARNEQKRIPHESENDSCSVFGYEIGIVGRLITQTHKSVALSSSVGGVSGVQM